MSKTLPEFLFCPSCNLAQGAIVNDSYHWEHGPDKIQTSGSNWIIQVTCRKCGRQRKIKKNNGVITY
jgi:hypothetical protein